MVVRVYACVRVYVCVCVCVCVCACVCVITGGGHTHRHCHGCLLWLLAGHLGGHVLSGLPVQCTALLYTTALFDCEGYSCVLLC